MINIDISDPCVDPKLLFESFCWWYSKQFNFFVDGRGWQDSMKLARAAYSVVGRKSGLTGTGVDLDHFVRYVGMWSKSSVGAWKSGEWDASICGARVLVGCWAQLGFLLVVGDEVWFLEFRPRCDSDIKSKGGVV